MAFAFKVSRRVRAITFASRKSRHENPLHRRTEEIGTCIADPFAHGEGAKVIDTFAIPKGAGGCMGPVTKLAAQLEVSVQKRWWGRNQESQSLPSSTG